MDILYMAVFTIEELEAAEERRDVNNMDDDDLLDPLQHDEDCDAPADPNIRLTEFVNPPKPLAREEHPAKKQKELGICNFFVENEQLQ